MCMQVCRFSVFSFVTANNYQMVIFFWDCTPCTPYIYLRLYGIFKTTGLPAARGHICKLCVYYKTDTKI